MITYSQIQKIASDLEFVSTIIGATLEPDAEASGYAWWYEFGRTERKQMVSRLKLAAEILNTLTIEQVEALPSYLRAA